MTVALLNAGGDQPRNDLAAAFPSDSEVGACPHTDRGILPGRRVADAGLELAAGAASLVGGRLAKTDVERELASRSAPSTAGNLLSPDQLAVSSPAQGVTA